MSPSSRNPLLRRLGGACLAVLAAGAHAAIDTGANDDVGNPEYVVVIWDVAREASYTLDLGVRVDEILAVGDDNQAGHQQFWELDRASDANLDRLLDLGSAVGSLRWGVFAADVAGFPGLPGDLRLFTTMEHETPTGVVNPNYGQLTTIDDLQGEQAIFGFGNWLADLNTDSANANNQHGGLGAGGSSGNYDFDGSSFTVKGQLGYFAAANYASESLALSGGPSTTNVIGRSSWAYRFTQGGFFDSTAKIAVDEYDNTEHDAYWGLAQDPDSGVLYLSFTLDAVGLTQAQREFALGIGRTEFDGGFRVRRLDGVAVAAATEFASGLSRPLGLAEALAPGITAAVPEPGTYALMALGVLGIAAAARRR